MLEALSVRDRMLALGERQERRLQVALVNEGGRRAALAVASRDEETGEWARHARAKVREAGEEMERLTEPPQLTVDRCPTELSPGRRTTRTWKSARSITVRLFRG